MKISEFILKIVIFPEHFSKITKYGSEKLVSEKKYLFLEFFDEVKTLTKLSN